MSPRQEPDIGLRKAIDAAGSVRALARILKVTHPAILGWGRVPPRRVLQIEAATGVPRSVMRPDIYPPNEYPQVKKAVRK